MPSSRRTPSPICNTSSGRKGGKGGKADIHCQGAALEVLAGGSKGQPPSGGSPAPPCPRPTALPPAGTQPAGSRAPLQMGQGDLGGQTSQLSDQRGLQELTTREGEGWAPVVSVPLARGSRKRPIQGTSAARETPPGPRPGSEALLGLGGRGHAAGPAARPWVSVCPRGQRCLPHLPARSRETSRGEGECSPCPTGCRAPPGGSADGEVRAVGHCVREDTRPGGRGPWWARSGEPPGAGVCCAGTPCLPPAASGFPPLRPRPSPFQAARTQVQRRWRGPGRIGWHKRTATGLLRVRIRDSPAAASVPASAPELEAPVKPGLGPRRAPRVARCPSVGSLCLGRGAHSQVHRLQPGPALGSLHSLPLRGVPGFPGVRPDPAHQLQHHH